jgi:hypothetical protein
MNNLMSLPEGKTCSDCNHFDRCSKICGISENKTECDFYPILYSDKELYELLAKENWLRNEKV